MRALQVTETTGPEGLEIRDIPAPEPGDGVLIDVEAAGVAFPDLLMTRGLYQYKPDPPFTPGAEVAGTVASAPDTRSDLKEGDRVMAFLLGGFQERVLAPPHTTFKVPDSFSIEQAAGFPMNYHTAHFALHRRGRLERGETVLVHGAAGGVGTATIQVAKGAGAKVIAVVSSDKKEEVARRAGADEVVRSDSDWLSATKELTDGKGIDVVMDPVGGDDRFKDSVRSLGPEGRLLVVGFTEGNIPKIAVNRLLLRNVSVVGVAWGAFVLDKPDLCRQINDDLTRLADEGFVDPIVSDVYPLEEGAKAVKQIDERGALGKIVLKL